MCTRNQRAHRRRQRRGRLLCCATPTRRRRLSFLMRTDASAMRLVHRLSGQSWKGFCGAWVCGCEMREVTVPLCACLMAVDAGFPSTKTVSVCACVLWCCVLWGHDVHGDLVCPKTTDRADKNEFIRISHSCASRGTYDAELQRFA